MKKDQSKRLSSKDAQKSPVSKASSLTSLLNTISELEVRHKRLKELVENVEDVLVDIDTNGRVLYVTPNVEKYLGYRPEEVIGIIPTIFMPQGEFAEKYSHFIELASQGRKLEAMEMTYIHKEGHHFIMEACAVPYFGNEGQLLGYRGVVRNITERKKAEVQLKESRQQLEEVAEKYSTIVKTTSDGVWINNLKGEILEVNDAYCRISGYSRDELIHMSVSELEAVETPQEIADHIRKTVEMGGHERFETCHRRKDGSNIDVEISSLFFKKNGGRIAIFIRDITDRKRAEEALRQSEQLFRSYFDSPLVGKAISVPDKGIIEVNDQICSMWGYSRDELLSMKWSDLTHPDDLAADVEQFKRILAGEIDSYSLDKRFIRKDGEIIWAILAVGCVRDSEGKVRQFAGSILDITERKRAEEAVQESEKRLKAIVEELDLRNRIAVIFLTVPDNEMYGEVLQVILKFTDSPYGVFGYIDENGDVVAPSLTRDVWEECRVNDKAISFPRSKWKDTVWVKAILQKKTIISNQPGRVPDGHIPITCVMVTPILFQDRCIGYLKVANRPSHYSDNDRILLERIAGYMAPALDARLQRDIEERKRRGAEEALLESERKYRQLVQNTTAIILRVDLQGRITFINEFAQNFFGYSANEILGRHAVGTIIPEWDTTGRDLAAMVDQIVADPDRFHANSNENIRKTGERVWVEWTNTGIFDSEGRLREFLAVGIDITERKRAEDFLQNEKVRLEVAQESAQAGTFEWDIQAKRTIWSDQLKALYGFAPGEFKGFENWSSRVHPDDLRKAKRDILESLTTGKYDSDFRVIWPDGSLHWLAARGRVIFDEHGSPHFMTGINMDITERKRAEEALTRSRDELEDRVQERTYDLSRIAEELRKSEEAYRLLVELNPVGVYRHVYDPIHKKSKRLHCNHAQLKLLGYSSLNEYLKDFPENTMIEEDWKMYISSLVPEGKIVNFPAQMKRKDGQIIWVLINAATRADGENLIIEGAVTDISEQKRTEERLRVARKKLRAMASEIVIADERSRQHFAADLHDTVIQTIGAVRMRSQLIQNEIPEKISTDYRELQDLLSQSITQARLLMVEMSPPVLNELGLIPALEWLTEQIESQHGINIDFNAIDGFTPLQHDIQVLLFQATRELLMNIVKHAEADKALVKVSGGKQKIRIEIIDDGKGFDKRQAFRTDVSSGGFGLFSIRERIRHFGGHLIIQSEEGKGTRVVLTAPNAL